MLDLLTYSRATTRSATYVVMAEDYPRKEFCEQLSPY